MTVRKASVFLVFVIAVGALPPGLVPIHLSYVYSDSMEPTIGVNDGYVLVPPDEVREGDIVVYRSPERGAYVTHRVVGRTAGGYVTKGDNNPVTDQRAGFDPVPRSAIVGEVLTIGGKPLIIPEIGVVLSFLRRIRYGVAALAIALVGIEGLLAPPSSVGGSHGPR